MKQERTPKFNLGRPALVLLFALTLGSFLTGCPREPEVQKAQENLLEDEDYIRIGVAIPLTGATAGFGVSIQRGIDMAITELNNLGGVYKKKFTALYEDTQGKAPFAQSLARKLATTQKADFLIGSASSTETFEMAKVAEELKIPLLVPVATNPAVTLDEEGKALKFVFRVCFTDELQGRAIARFAVKGLNARKIAIVWDSSSTYSRHLREVILERLRINYPDAEIAADEAFIGGGIVTSFKPMVDRLIEKDFDTLIVPAYYTDAVGLIKEIAGRKLNINILGGDGFASYEFLRSGGSAIEGVYFTNHFSADSPNQKVQKFNRSFHEAYETEPDAFAALSYDAVELLADAINRAGTLDGERVAQALSETRNFDGITGRISIDENHNAVKNVIVEKIENMRFKTVGEITPREIEDEGVG